MERERADLLAGAGYTVRSNGERAHVAPQDRIRFDRSMMEPALDYVDQATFSILARVGHPISSAGVVGLLRNDRSSEIQALMNQDLPIPEIGRFGHADPAVLSGRLDDLVAAGHLMLDAAGDLWFSRRTDLGAANGLGSR